MCGFGAARRSSRDDDNHPRGSLRRRDAFFYPPAYRAMKEPDAGRGIALSVGASALFALMAAYAKLLAPLTGLDIFAWRILFTAPGAMLLLALRGRVP